MPRGVAHDDGTRAAVLASLLTGQSVNAVAQQYRIGRSTVIAWRDSAGLGSTHVEPQKYAEWSELVAGVLRELLTTVQIQAVAYRDAAWLARQNAADAAVLTGVLLDKAVRILEAAEPVEPEEPAVPT